MKSHFNRITIVDSTGFKLDDKPADTKYLPTLQNTIEKDDLSLKDLGYFKTEDLKFIKEKEDLYISRLKINTSLYKKEGIIEY